MNRSLTGLGDSNSRAGIGVGVPGSSNQTADPVWTRLSLALKQENPDFREARPLQTSVPLLADPPLVGSAVGRMWEVRFLRSRFMARHPIVGLTTGIGWIDPAKMRREPIPWFYVGPRPRLLARTNAELDRFMQWYRRSEGHTGGVPTGDAHFDRQWVVYASRPEVAYVLGKPAYRNILRGFAELRPNRSDDLPTVTIVGSTAVLSLVVGDSDTIVRGVAHLPQAFGNLLDQIEAAVGQVPAGSRPLAMDFVPDETGYPEPALRLQCSNCGQETHPRHRLDLETDLCDGCGKSFYQFL